MGASGSVHWLLATHSTQPVAVQCGAPLPQPSLSSGSQTPHAPADDPVVIQTVLGVLVLHSELSASVQATHLCVVLLQRGDFGPVHWPSFRHPTQVSDVGSQCVPPVQPSL